MNTETPITKTFKESALELKVIECKNNKNEEGLTLMMVLYVIFSDESVVCYTFLISDQKSVAADVKSYTCRHVTSDTHEILTEYKLYRKDISSTLTSNMIKCPDCEETHFQWTDTKLELVSGQNETVDRVDPIALSLKHIMQHGSIALGATMRIIPKEDM